MRGAIIERPPRPGANEPAPPVYSGGDGGGRWAWLVTARNVYEAELLRGSLEAAGVSVALVGRDSSPFSWMYPAGNMNVPVRVFVPQTLLDVARLHLLESNFGSDELAPDPPPDTRRPATRRRWWLVIAVASALAVLLLLLIDFFGQVPCRGPRPARLVPLCSVR